MKKNSVAEVAYDPAAPGRLCQTQRWFGAVISQPLNAGEHVRLKTPWGGSIKEESAEWIHPSPTLEPYERIELYSQQYWWRLLRIMEQNFPFVIRLLGRDSFRKEIVEPYFQTAPPSDWALRLLGRTLPHWMERYYRDKDKDFLCLAAHIDVSYMMAFLAEHEAPLVSGVSEETLLELPLQLQPSVSLFALDRPLFALRSQCIQESGEDVDYWLTKTPPQCEAGKTEYLLLYRNAQYQAQVQTISYEAYRYYQLFRKPCSIAKSLDWITRQPPAQAFLLQENLGELIREAVRLGLFACKDVRNQPLTRSQG